MSVDVTEQIVADVRYARTLPAHLRNLRPATKLTPAGRAVLDTIDGTRLGYVSNPLVYESTFRHWPKQRHKTLLRLLLGGHVRVLRVDGPLPGEHLPGRVGAHADNHYLLQKVSSRGANK